MTVTTDFKDDRRPAQAAQKIPPQPANFIFKRLAQPMSDLLLEKFLEVFAFLADAFFFFHYRRIKIRRIWVCVAGLNFRPGVLTHRHTLVS